MKFWILLLTALFAMFAAIACEDKPGAELAKPDVAAEKEAPKAVEAAPKAVEKAVEKAKAK